MKVIAFIENFKKGEKKCYNTTQHNPTQPNNLDLIGFFKKVIIAFLIIALFVNVIPTPVVNAASSVTSDGFSYVSTGGNCAYAPYYSCDLYVKQTDVTEEKYMINLEQVLNWVATAGTVAAIKLVAAELAVTYPVAENIVNAGSFFVGVSETIKGSESILYRVYSTTYMCRGYVNGELVEETIYEIVEHRKYGVINTSVVDIGSENFSEYDTDREEDVKTAGITSDEDFMTYCIGRYYNDYHTNEKIGGGHKYTYGCSKYCYECGGKRNASHSYYRSLCTEYEKCVYCGIKGAEPKSEHTGMVTANCLYDTHCEDCTYTEYGTAKEYHNSYLVDPTCTDVGYCSKCMYKIKPLGHEFKDATCEKAMTCVRCGLQSGNALGHDWAAATCYAPKKCSRCNKIEGLPLGHAKGTEKCGVETRCTRCNVILEKAKDHTYAEATCTGPQKCTKCGYEELG